MPLLHTLKGAIYLLQILGSAFLAILFLQSGIDKIIDPMETRDAITMALEAAALNPDVPEFKVGVLQT